MAQGRQLLPKTEFNFHPAIRPLIFAVIAGAIAAVLFAPFGIIYKHADLSFLAAPLIIFFVLRLLSKLCSIYLPAYALFYHAEAAAHFFNGLALSLLFFLALGNSDTLIQISLFGGARVFLTNLSHAAGYAALFVFGITVSKLAAVYRITEWGRPLYPIANALGQFFTGLGIWQFLAAFSGSWGPLNEIGLVIYAGMLAVAIANAGHYGEKSRNPFLADASSWLIRSSTLEFFTGAFIAVYILFVRPFITQVFRYAPFIEWAIVLFIGWRLFSGIKNGIRTRYAVDVHETDWQKHVQLIANLQGADFPHLRELQEAFIEDSSRDAFLIYLTLLMNNNKVSAEEITRILHPMIDYRDTKVPWFAFRWEQRRVISKNEANRRLILAEIMANLKYILNPANQKIEEHANE